LVVVEVELMLTLRVLVVQVVEEQEVVLQVPHLIQDSQEHHVKVMAEKTHRVVDQVLVVVAVEKVQAVVQEIPVEVVLM
tara:strand:+ start:215 stop:451 length:237 start_codon:yes stop_codon:yes gene_type:complete